MKILVTGGCGFIGSNLGRHMIAETDHEVVNLDKLTYAGDPSLLVELEEEPRHQFCRVDISDAGSLATVFAEHAPDAVMHLAAESHVDRSIDGPAAFVETNVTGTFCLLSAALDHYRSLNDARADGFRFIHVSTDEVYGALGKTGRFTESTPYDPHSPYSATKAASDHLARAWQTTYGLPVIVTNCSNNYGPYQFPEKLLPLMVIKCLSEQPLPVYGKGENVRDWLHVSDHVRALLAVLERGEVGETYNVGGDSERRNIELVRSVCEIMDQLLPRDAGHYADLISFVTDRPGHDFRYAIDSSKLQRELNWRPRHDLDTGLRQTIKWYLEHQTWWRGILDARYQLERLGNDQAVDET